MGTARQDSILKQQPGIKLRCLCRRSVCVVTAHCLSQGAFIWAHVQEECFGYTCKFIDTEVQLWTSVDLLDVGWLSVCLIMHSSPICLAFCRHQQATLSSLCSKALRCSSAVSAAKAHPPGLGGLLLQTDLEPYQREYPLGLTSYFSARAGEGLAWQPLEAEPCWLEDEFWAGSCTGMPPSATLASLPHPWPGGTLSWGSKVRLSVHQTVLPLAGWWSVFLLLTSMQGELDGNTACFTLSCHPNGLLLIPAFELFPDCADTPSLLLLLLPWLMNSGHFCSSSHWEDVFWAEL